MVDTTSPGTETENAPRNDLEVSDQLQICRSDQPKITSDSTFAKPKGKPKWWKQVAGQKATKGQRACLHRMLKRDFVLEKLPGPFAYTGEYIELDCLFTRTYDSDSATQSMPHDESAPPPLIVEIGFGRGDNLFWTAMNNPQYRYLGAELYKPGLCHLLKFVEDSVYGDAALTKFPTLWRENEPLANDKHNKFAERPDLRNDAAEGHASSQAKPQHDVSDNISDDAMSHLKTNLRVYGGDGMKLVKCLPPWSVSTILITFPDPFACSSNEKWRILQLDSILEFERVLQRRNQATKSLRKNLDIVQGFPLHGRFFLATDDVTFDRWTRQLFRARASQLINKEFAHENSKKQEISKSQNNFFWREVLGSEIPCRSIWLPVISQYEAKGVAEGRSTFLQCWELFSQEDLL